MAGIAESLRLDLSAPDPEFAEGYAESFLNTYIAAQIKTIRQQRKMTQDDLAGVLDTTQTVVSRIENVNYAAWSIGTLKKIARAFDIRLKVSFEEYGTLPEEIETFSKERLMRAKRTEDPRLNENIISQAELVAHAAMPAPLADFGSESFPDFGVPDVHPDLFAGSAKEWAQSPLNSLAGGLSNSLQMALPMDCSEPSIQGNFATIYPGEIFRKHQEKALRFKTEVNSGIPKEALYA